MCRFTFLQVSFLTSREREKEMDGERSEGMVLQRKGNFIQKRRERWTERVRNRDGGVNVGRERKEKMF